MGLQKRASLFGGLGLLFLVGILVFSGFRAVQETTQRSLNERVAVAQMVARGVDQSLLAAQDELEGWALKIDLNDADYFSDRQLLDNLYTFSRTFSHLFIVDKTGSVIATQPSSISDKAQSLIAVDRGVSRVLNASPSAITSVSMAPLYTGLMFSISVPIYGDEWQVTGAVIGHVDLSGILGSFIQPLDLGSTAFTEVVSESGMVMASSKSPSDTSPEETEYAAHFASLIRQSDASMETCFRCHDTGRGITRIREVLAFAPLGAASGGVAIRQTEEEALAPSQGLLRNLILAGSPLLVLGLLFLWISTRTLVKPVLELTMASRRIAGGDLDAPITINRSDELGLLAQTFDQMRIGLKESLAQKEERAVESESRARHLAALNSVASTVGRSLDLEQILQDSLEQVIRLMPIEAGYIFLEGNNSHGMRLHASKNPDEKWMEHIRYLRNEAGSETEVVTFNVSLNGETATFIRVPLSSKGQNRGIMWLASIGILNFTSEEKELLSSIGHQVGVAIDNVRLFQETGKREGENQALYRLGIEISRLFDLDRILTTVVDSALKLSGANATILAVYDDVSHEVYLRAISGELNPEFKNLQMKMSKTDLVNEVLNRGQSLSTLDYLNDSAIGHGPMVDDLFRKSALKSCLAVPMKIGERVSGVLMALYKEKNNFSEREMELLQQFANQAAVALENTRLYNQVQDLAVIEERTRLSREMHDSLGQVLGYLGLQVDEIGILLSGGKTKQAVKRLEEIRKTVTNASEDVRHLILALRTTVSPEVELPSVLREYLDTFQRQTGIRVNLDIRSKEATRFSSKVALQLTRVIQEALSNVRKHAGADQVEVRFEIIDDDAVVSITDNGRGFEPSNVFTAGQHFGIQVMDERMTGLGGSLEIESAPGEGTKISARLRLEFSCES